MEEKASGSKRKSPSCSRCHNHGEEAPLMHHKCPFEECICLLCKLTYLRKATMRKQQQLWRRRKEEAAAEGLDEGDVDFDDGGGKQKGKYCDMCRHHDLWVKNKGHKGHCAYEKCHCDYCSFSRKRRDIMKIHQKVMRAGFTTEQFKEATEWVATLEKDLLSLGIDDVPIPAADTAMSLPRPNLHQDQSQYQMQHTAPPPAQQVLQSHPSCSEGPYSHQTQQQGLYHQIPEIDSFGSHASCSRMTRNPSIMPETQPSNPSISLSAAITTEQYPQTFSFPMEFAAGGGPSCSSTSSSAMSGQPYPSFHNTSSSSFNLMHMQGDSMSSFPSPYPSLSTSPLSDYDPSSSPYQAGCSSPLMPYSYGDGSNREPMVPASSHQQPMCTMLRNTVPSSSAGGNAEPLDTKDYHAHSSRPETPAKNRLLQQSIDNRSIHNNPRTNLESHPKTYFHSERRRSEGVIQAYPQHSQRLSSQEKYNWEQRRRSEGIISERIMPMDYQKTQSSKGDMNQGMYRPDQNPRGNKSGMIREKSYPAEEIDITDDIPQTYGNPMERSTGAIEKYQSHEDRFQRMHQSDKRRNSDGVIHKTCKFNERRSSEGFHLKHLGVNQGGILDRGIQMPLVPSFNMSSEEFDSTSSGSERRGSDTMSQESCIQDDYRRNSSDFPHDHYYLHHRRDSGETIPGGNWSGERRDSDGFDLSHHPSMKEHFFENSLKRQVHDKHNMHGSSDYRYYYIVSAREEVTDSRQSPNMIDTQIDEDIDRGDNAMNQSDSHGQVDVNIPPQIQYSEDIDAPLDLRTNNMKNK